MSWPTTTVTIAAVLAVLGLAGALAWRPWQRRRRTREERRALQAFRIQREQLEARFLDMARAAGKPRGVRWIECDWHDAVEFARDCRTGLLTAFVAVNVRFEAIEGGDMAEVEAVGLIRDAAAVFHHQHGRWGTGGRVLFNMNPEDAVSRLAGQYERVGPLQMSPPTSP